MITNSYEKKWLIKSDQKITGPFSYEQVEELLRKRQISLIDEIRDMERRWSFIREVPELKDLVETVRKEVDNSNELTQTVQTKANQETQSINRKDVTVTKEMTMTPISESTLKQDAVSEILAQAPVGHESESVIDVSFKENIAEKNQTTISPQPKAKVVRFGAATDYSVQQEVKSDSSKYVIGFAAILIAGLLGYIGYNYNKQMELQRQEAEIVNQIRRYAMNGNNERVVEAYSKAPAHIRRRALPDLINYFPLLQNYEVSTKEDFINRLKLEVSNKSKKALIDMFLFHRSMSIKDFGAANSYLTTAKDYDPTSEIILENEALYSLSMEKHKDAYNQFSALLKKEVKGRWLLGQLLAQYKMGEFNDSKGQQDIIDKYLITQTRMDFKRELLMFQMYLAKKDNNKRFFEQSMRDYVGGPTQFAINYRVDPLVWMPGYDFKVFDTLYQFIIGKQKGFDLDKLGITFLATYALENQRYEEVQLFIKSSSLESSNPDKLNIHFQYLMLQGRKMEAMAVIKSSGVENLTSFSQFLVYKTLTENREFRSSYGDFFRRSGEIIEQEKNFFTLYAKFTELRAGATPEDKNKLRAFLDDNLSSVTDFTPFLLAKGELN